MNNLELVINVLEYSPTDCKRWIELGLRLGSSKGELFVEDLDFGKEINIYTNLGSWRTVLEGGDAR